MHKITLGGPWDVRARRELGNPIQMLANHEDLFTDDFMARYTKFSTYIQMIKAWGKELEAATGTLDLRDTDWEDLVSKKTRFRNFYEMRVRATAEWLEAQEREAQPSA